MKMLGMEFLTQYRRFFEKGHMLCVIRILCVCYHQQRAIEKYKYYQFEPETQQG